MGKLPVWAWVALGLAVVFVAYKKGLLGGLLPAPVSTATLTGGSPVANVPAPPTTGTSNADIIKSALDGIFGLAGALVKPKTTATTT